MAPAPRVALFTDSYLEINGVARTIQQFEAFAAASQRPLLLVHGGATTGMSERGTARRMALRRGRLAFGLERDLRFDLALWRHRAEVRRVLVAFEPDLVHITGPSDVGQLGALLAHQLRLPLVASWHTNLHEYAGSRLGSCLGRVASAAARQRVARAVTSGAWSLLLDFYRMARVILAPNPDLGRALGESTGRPVRLMSRGVDPVRFTPARRSVDDGVFRIGYVGRVSVEKNVQVLVDLERALLAAGPSRFRLLVVGDGGARLRLERELRTAHFTGVLTGEALAQAYANLDLLVFPSETDTVGNVILESLASGTPVVAAARGGHRFLIDGYTCEAAEGPQEFARIALGHMRDPVRHAAVREAARERACGLSWDRVFEAVYDAYRECLDSPGTGEGAGAPVVRAATGLGRLVSAGVGRRAAPPVAVAALAGAGAR